MEIKIIVATHLQCEMPKDALYLPVQVGKALHDDRNFGFQCDNEGDNISAKNPYYSELTAIYWAWKNCTADYIGLVHYRRLFSLCRRKHSLDYVLNSAEAQQLCQHYDLILPKRRRLFIETVYSHYDHTFDGKQFDGARIVLEQCCPEYMPAFDKSMQRRAEHLYNKFIMKREHFDKYCTWLFPILEKIEAQYDLEKMDPFQARVIGRVSERLLDVWVIKNNLKYKEIDYVHLGNRNIVRKVYGFIMAKFFGRKYKQSF